MNVVFLSPHFPPGMHLYVRRIREAGATVLGIADVAYEALRPELRAARTEYYRVDDLHSIDQLTRAVGYFTHRYGKVDRLESLNEYWLATDARLRSEFNIPGLRAEGIDKADMFYWIDREIAPDLDALGRHTVRAFGVRERPFHFEFFRLPDGELTALEVNMRQPGGLTVDMWNWTSDIDFYRAWAEVVVNGTTRVSPEKRHYVLWAGRKAGRTYRLAHEDVLRRFAKLLIHHERVDDVFATALGNYGYIMREPRLDPLLAAAHEILALA